MAKLAAAVSSGLVRARRRKLPFGRAAVLSVNGRDHIVGLADVSATGAFLITTVSFSVGHTVVVKVMPNPGRREVSLPGRVVRVAQTGEESPQHPHGIAVQFSGLDLRTREILEDFVNRVPKRQRTS
jgi:Tfp pilus assembly protein PilZ